MKKLLVTLLLGAGLVSVASATVVCNSRHAYNQCCADKIEMFQDGQGNVQTTDGYSLSSLSGQLIDDGTSGTSTCETTGNYTTDDSKGNAAFEWTQGEWQNTLKHAPN